MKIVFAVLFILCAVPIGFGLRNIGRAVASPSWPKTTGVVKTSETVLDSVRDEHNRRSSTMYEAKITFQYEVNGRTYSTDTLHFGQIAGSGDSSDAELRRVRYPVGAPVTISLRSRKPFCRGRRARVRLGRALPPGRRRGLCPSVAHRQRVLVRKPGIDERHAARVRNIRRSLLRHRRAVSDHQPGQFFAGPRKRALAGRVGRHRLRETDRRTSAVTTSDRNTYRVSSSSTDLVYRYEVDGKQHYFNVRRFGQLAAASGNWAADIAKRYPLGQSVSVRYDPANPNLAVLEPGFDTECYWAPGAGAAFFLFGVAVFIVVSRL